MTDERLYAALLRLYPTAFRREFGEPMVDAFREASRDNRRPRGYFWLSIIADLGCSACREHLRVHREWGHVAALGLAHDGNVLRGIVPAFALQLSVLTLILMLPPIMQVAPDLIAKGADWWTIARLMLALVPQGLGVTIPMAVLIGLLMGLGRSSGDRETVALQARGIGIYRMLRPVGLLAAIAMAATSYVVIVAVPDANQTYRDIVRETTIALDPESVVPSGGLEPGLREMTLPQLQAQVAMRQAQGASTHNEIIEMHTRFSLPVACVVFAIIGLALGVTSRRDGRLASFTMGIGVLFAYYVIMNVGRGMAKGAVVSPHLAMWLPNIILGGLGVALLVWHARCRRHGDLDLA